MNQRQLRPFIWTAWLGVLTTALNTGIPIFFRGHAGATEIRNVILLVHAPATLLPVLGLALACYREQPFLAVVAMVATALEKGLEFIGQTLAVFPPLAEPPTNLVPATWDRLFFVLWCCNTVGATAAGFLIIAAGGTRRRRLWAGFAWGAALLTGILVLGQDYVKLLAWAPNAWLFAVVFTGYRVALAVALQSAGRNEAG